MSSVFLGTYVTVPEPTKKSSSAWTRMSLFLEKSKIIYYIEITSLTLPYFWINYQGLQTDSEPIETITTEVDTIVQVRGLT